MRRNDAIHLGLMLSAFAAAYLVPFELLLLAYVVLGPAHYFTKSPGCTTAATFCPIAASHWDSPSSPSLPR